jgi:hypothetical protein
LKYYGGSSKNNEVEYGMCYYQVGNPKYTYKNGHVLIKFKKIESGVNVYLNSGSDVRNMTGVIVPKNGSVSVGTEYKIDQSVNFIITAISNM